MSTITWLHLSDLHFREGELHTWNEDVVLRSLLKDVEESIEKDGLRPDFIVVTGDIAFSGKKAEYALARRFFDDLLQTTETSKARLFLVPGNHDVDRSLISSAARFTAANLRDRHTVNQILSHPDDRALMLKRFKGYAAFVNDYLGDFLCFNDDRYFYVRKLDFPRRQIAILGLNSAWLAQGDEDRNRLALSERQVRSALDMAKHADLRLALLHHPFVWLHDFDRGDTEALLSRDCDFVLHGHMHRVGLTWMFTPDGEAMIIAAGASYEKRTFSNAYNIVQLDTAQKRGTIHLRRYSDERGGFWVPDVESYKNVKHGRHSFRLAGQREVVAEGNGGDLLPSKPDGRYDPRPKIAGLMIGRHHEMQVVRDALDHGNIVFLTGVAGIGKTVLLEEARRLAQERGYSAPPIIDFHDIKMHDRRLLEEVAGSREEEERMLLCFDSVDLFECELASPQVIEDFELKPDLAPGWQSILEYAGGLKNTTLLIAARPTGHGRLKSELHETHGKRVRLAELAGFTIEETREACRQAKLDEEVVAKIHLLTEGHPLMVALVLDLLARGVWRPSMLRWDGEDLPRLVDLADEEERSGRRGMAWHRWDEVKRSFEQSLVQCLETAGSPELKTAIQRLALARKGCWPGLFAQMMEVSRTGTEGLVRELLSFPFVKLLPGPRDSEQRFGLHDVVREMVERYMWPAGPAAPEDPANPRGREKVYRAIIDQYDKEIGDLDSKMKGGRDWSARARLRRQQKFLMAEQLYYLLEADPREGYGRYIHLAEEALDVRAQEWDVWLRDEVLWFGRHRGKGPDVERRRGLDAERRRWVENGAIQFVSWLDDDFRRHWLERFIVAGEYQRTVRVADNLLGKINDLGGSELYRSGVRIALIRAKTYLGAGTSQSTLSDIERVTGILEDHPGSELEPEHRRWLSSYLLARAYLTLGMVLGNRRRLADASDACRRAFNCFRRIGYLPGQAEALDSLAYFLACQGKTDQGLVLGRDALNMREGMGDGYPLGLSLNTMAAICERSGRLHEAARFSQEAIKILTEIGSRRGVILAKINRGRVLRKMSRGSVWTENRSFREAGEALEEASRLLEDMGDNGEILRKVEVYCELGRFYRDWAAIFYEKGDIEGAVSRLEPARENLERVHSLLQAEGGQIPEGRLLPYIDFLQDLAYVYYWQARVAREYREEMWAKALGYLDQALDRVEAIKSQEALASRLGKLSIPSSWRNEGRRGQRVSDLPLGKIHHLFALIWQDRTGAAPEIEEVAQHRYDVAEHYAQAAGYLERYSPDLPELRAVMIDAVDWLRSLGAEADIPRLIDVMRNPPGKKYPVSERLLDWIGLIEERGL
jgi:3',5'-cyclic AMP phosphodiesterase CpdA/tetratricopeptide (TPR) repeat protein